MNNLKMIGEKPNNEIIVFLSPTECELFKSFREHQTDFMLLKSNGIFDTKNGSMTLHWNSEGILQKVEVNYIKWKNTN